jgi:hypothetical protein
VRAKKLRSKRGEKCFTARNSGAECARDSSFFFSLSLDALRAAAAKGAHFIEQESEKGTLGAFGSLEFLAEHCH